MTPASITFIVREGGRWWLTSVPGHEPEGIDLDVVLDLVPCGPARQTAHGRALSATAVVAPVWTFVGRAASEGLVVRTREGVEEALGHGDLQLLDLLSGPTAATDLVRDPAASGVDAAGDRLVRMVDLGVIALQAESAPDGNPPLPIEPRADTGHADLQTDSEPASVRRSWRRAFRRAAPAPASSVAHAHHTPGPEPSLGTEGPRTASGEPTDAPPPLIGPSGVPVPEGDPARIPVYAIWHPETGPLLSLGMLTAAARHHDGGALTEAYEIRRPETAESFLADQAGRPGPAILLCSDYVWNLEANLDAARAGVALNPDLLVIHGGPSSPKYLADAEQFIEQHGPVADVLTRGEGEHLICDLLETLLAHLPTIDPDALAAIPGLTFADPRTGKLVRTEDRERITDLDALESPYLTGEFDHIPIENWLFCLSIETNRGCPYSCSYCDWGSSTLSRIRKFSLDRVEAEIVWAARRGAASINLPDANFGIMSRDVDTAERIVRTRRATGYPLLLSFYPAKNTTRHLVRIMDVLVEGGVGTTASISLQTTDEATLEAIDRSNISTEHYVALAASYRRRGFPIQGDLLIGLPGQTYASYRNDLQFNFDHEIQARTWQLKILPNAPMNDPEYRERHQIRSDDQHRVRSTATFTEMDRIRMQRLRDLDIVSERLGVLRHILRWVQWDHGIQESEVLDRILDITEEQPLRFPHLTWVVSYFERHATAAAGWDALYAEVRDLLVSDLGLVPSSAMDVVFAVNRFLMPEPGREFPATIELAHDYVSYYREATSSLYTEGHATGPNKSLLDHGPARFTIESDPLDLCTSGLHFPRHGEGDEMESDFSIGANSANELLSPLVRLVPHLLTVGVTVHDLSPDAPCAQGLYQPEVPDPSPVSRVAVSLSPPR